MPWRQRCQEAEGSRVAAFDENDGAIIQAAKERGLRLLVAQKAFASQISKPSYPDRERLWGSVSIVYAR